MSIAYEYVGSDLATLQPPLSFLPVHIFGLRCCQAGPKVRMCTT